MRLAIAQLTGVPGNPRANLRLMEEKAAEAVAAGADLLVLPELFLSGHNLGEALADLAEPFDGPSVAEAAAIAGRHGVAVLLGYPERAGRKIYDSAALLGADGFPLGHYRKAHLCPMQKGYFANGDGLPMCHPVGDLTVGVLIGQDVEFPEAVRDLALRGCDAVVVPAALFTGFPFVTDVLVPARAIENHLFIAYADRCGAEGGQPYEGYSRVVGPDGVLIADTGDDEALLVADLDPEARDRAAVRCDYLEERRPALYSRLTDTSPMTTE